MVTILDTLHLVDPGLRPLLALWPTPTLSVDTLPAVRTRSLPPPFTEVAGVLVEERLVTGPAGALAVALRLCRPVPSGGLAGCLYHVHGGGFVMESAMEADVIYRPLAAALGCVVVSVDYRLAPEAVFPAAIEDCYAGLA